jgi:hypothetical protein
VIKRIRFASKKRALSFGTFSAAWPEAVALAAHAPPDARPSRAAVCTTLPGITGPAPKHDGIGIEWFADADHLRRFQDWLGTPQGRGLLERVGTIVDRDASPVVVAEEHVVRGADWLERRWRCGGAKFKHMAIALRASRLTAAEFSRRWRGHAGQVRSAGGLQVTVIPDTVRGRAYVQNHPSPRTVGEWAYDALNEVYFDDIAGLLGRVEWFRENPPQDDDMFGQSWFIAAREEIVPWPKALWSCSPPRPIPGVKTSSTSGTATLTCPSSAPCQDSSAPAATGCTTPETGRHRCIRT